MQHKFEKLSMNSLSIKGQTMLSKSESKLILALADKGKSIKAIQRITGHSRNTIRRYLQRSETQSSGTSNLGRPISVGRSFLNQHASEVRELFFRCNLRVPVLKRRLKERYNQEIPSYTLKRFCKAFRAEFHRETDPTIKRFETLPGVQMQIDFGELDVRINGESLRVHFFVGILCYSRRVFVKAYSEENTSTWLNGLACAFDYFGGRPVEIISDNARTLVKKPSAHSEEEKFTFQYLDFARKHQLKIHATAPYFPQSKGKVERAVRYVKENFFVDVQFSSMEELNEKLVEWCQESDERVLGIPDKTGGKSPKERWAIEREKIEERPVLERIYLEHHCHRKVDKNGFLRVDNQMYRVPDEAKSQEVDLIITDELIKVMLSGQEIITLNKSKDRYNVEVQTVSSLVSKEEAFNKRFEQICDTEEWRIYHEVGAKLNPECARYDAVFNPQNNGYTGGTNA